MADIAIDVKGLDQLIKQTGNAKMIIAEELRPAFLRSGLMIQRKAKETVPVDTGRLQKSITVFNTIAAKGMDAIISATAEYAPFVEYGTPVGTGAHGAPKPFMKPAAEQSSEFIANEFTEAAERIANRLTE